MNRYGLQCFCRIRRDSNLHEWRSIANSNDKAELESMIPTQHAKDFRIIDFYNDIDVSYGERRTADKTHRVFIEKVRKTMKERGLNCLGLSKITGISKQLLSCYFTGQNFPSLKNAVTIARALNSSLDELFGIVIEVKTNDEFSSL